MKASKETERIQVFAHTKDLEVEIERLKDAIQSLQEKVEKLEGHNTLGANARLASLENRANKLEKQVSEIDCAIDTHLDEDHIFSEVDFNRRLTSLESKPQDSRSEVMENAWALLNELKEEDRIVKTEWSVIFQALKLAEQSLEGGES